MNVSWLEKNNLGFFFWHKLYYITHGPLGKANQSLHLEPRWSHPLIPLLLPVSEKKNGAMKHKGF